MSAPGVGYFHFVYSAMSEDEFAAILRKATRTPGALAEPALEAIRQIVAERGIDVKATLEEERLAAAQDQAKAFEKGAVAANKSQRTSRVIGRIVGGLGIPCGLVLLYLSLAAGHLGGTIASGAWLITSAWALFAYKGD